MRLTDAPLTANDRIGKSATQGGTYDSIGGAVSGSTITSNAITSFSFFNIGALATETDVAVSGGNLVITDVNGGNTDDMLTISRNGANIRISDPNHTLTAGAGATQIDPNTVDVPFASISGNIQVNALGGNDLVTLDFSGGNMLPAGGLSYAGGTQTASPGDRLAIVGGSQGTVTYNYTNANDGNINMSAYGTVSYTGLEPISNSGTATDIIFNLPAGPNTITLADDGSGGNLMSRLSGATIEQTDFANPSGSVTVAAGNGADTIAVNTPPDLTASLTLTAGPAAFNTITFGGTVTLAPNKNLSGTASSLIAVNGNLTTSSAGTMTLTAADVSGSGNLSTGGGLVVDNTGTSTLSGVIAGGGATLTKQGLGTLVLPNTHTYGGPTQINSGVLNVNGSTSAASFFTVNGPGKLGGSGTVGGPVNINSGGSVAPGNSAGILNTGNVGFGGGSTFAVEINGATAGSGYDQLNVTGTVALGNATLALSGTHAPVAGQQFTIVSNDGADPITGTFSGLAEGATINNFLGSSLNASITYAYGTNNNDVVLTVFSPCTPQSTVYVDDSWVGTPIGADPDMGGPATSFGCDSFATIQAGVNAVTAGGTVNVAAGSYVENVTIPKALTLTGAGAASVFLTPAVSNPNCGGAGGGSLCAGASNLILVQADNVTISGLTLDGDNPSLTSGQVFGGADIDARNGIITNHLAGVFNNLEVHHTAVKNIWLRGMYASSGGTFNFHDNTVQNVQANPASIGMFNFGGAGAYTNNNVSLCNDAISSNHSRGTTYTGNTVTTSGSGIHTDNAGDGGGAGDIISGNTVTNSQAFGYGIWTFVPYLPVTVSNNTVTNVDVGLASAGGISTPVASTFTGNTVDGQNKVNSTGVYLTTDEFGFGQGNNLVEFKSNTVVNNLDGFYLEAKDSTGAAPISEFNKPPVAVNVSEPGYMRASAKQASAPDVALTLTANVSFNRIVNNTGSSVTHANNLGTLAGTFENNWFGCNAGPNNPGCGNVVGSGVDFDPWIVLGISAAPSTIPPGGSTTVTADMTHNSNGAVPSVTEFVPQVAVTFGAVNGTVFPTSGTISSGQKLRPLLRIQPAAAALRRRSTTRQSRRQSMCRRRTLT